MKHLPPELCDWYFPFNWEVNEVWELEGKNERRNVEDLEWHLAIPFWSSERGKGMLFDLKPRDVLEKPGKYSCHISRIQEADLGYPVCLTEYKGREIIIDGLHRLAKLVSENIETVDVKVINAKSIENIAKYA